MVNYIIRRLLLIIPTLFGITLLVFLLLAMSPGGIGASLVSGGAGGTMQNSNALALQRARLEDRYGLNESVMVQYGRWLTRISPIKFGQRDLISPEGDIVSRPRPIPEPVAWQWVAKSLPEVNKPGDDEIRKRFPADDDVKRVAEFKKVVAAYADARGGATAADVTHREAIKRYVSANVPYENRGAYLKKERLRSSRLRDLKPDANAPEYAEVERSCKAAIEAWAKAAAAREVLIAAMATRPYEESGFGISGVVGVALPDLGVAFSRNQRVIDLIGTHLPVTLLINLLSIPIIYLIAIPSGMLAAVRRGTIADVGLGGLYIGLYSIPAVLAGVLFLGFLATPEYLGLFPAASLHDKDAERMTFLPVWENGFNRGYLLDMFWHVVLPVTCLVYGGFAVLSKQTRAAMLENLNADYVRTAKAKGVSSKDVIFVHVMRNSLLPLITIFVTVFPAMLAGSVVIEKIFSVPGMGFLLLDAIGQRDRELILANTTIIAVVNLLALLLADLLYAMADPRITYK